jgi:hypothetical protein
MGLVTEQKWELENMTGNIPKNFSKQKKLHGHG